MQGTWVAQKLPPPLDDPAGLTTHCNTAAAAHTVRLKYLLQFLQAGLLAQQDSWAPCAWVAVQSVLNVIGDLVLIMYFKQGLAGAAWATVVSQLVGTIGLLWMFKFRGQVTFASFSSHCTETTHTANRSLMTITCACLHR